MTDNSLIGLSCDKAGFLIRDISIPFYFRIEYRFLDCRKSAEKGVIVWRKINRVDIKLLLYPRVFSRHQCYLMLRRFLIYENKNKWNFQASGLIQHNCEWYGNQCIYHFLEAWFNARRYAPQGARRYNFIYKVFWKDKLRYYTEKPSHFSCRIVCQNYLVDFRWRLHEKICRLIQKLKVLTQLFLAYRIKSLTFFFFF